MLPRLDAIEVAIGLKRASALHRGDVLAALAHAVDDRKRAVRMAAVRCRRAWSTT